jgi:hypothetical protein
MLVKFIIMCIILVVARHRVRFPDAPRKMKLTKTTYPQKDQQNRATGQCLKNIYHERRRDTCLGSKEKNKDLWTTKKL